MSSEDRDKRLAAVQALCGNEDALIELILDTDCNATRTAAWKLAVQGKGREELKRLQIKIEVAALAEIQGMFEFAELGL